MRDAVNTFADMPSPSPGLRPPSPDGRGIVSLADRRVAIWLAFITFIACAWFHAGGGWNQNAAFDLTRAIVERHTFAIDAYAGNTGDVSRFGGHLYANKAPGLSFLAAVPYALLRAVESSDPSLPMLLTMNAYLCSLVVVALPAALIPALLFLFARRRGVDARWATIVALTTALGTQLLPYGTVMMIAVPSAMLLLFAFTSRHDVAAGLALGVATSMNYLCAPAIVAFALLRRRRVPFVAAALLPLAIVTIYQRIAFGSFVRTSIATMDERFVNRRALFGIIELPSLEAAWGITFSPYRGLFFFAPVLLLSFAGAWFWFRRNERRGELAAIAFVALVFFTFNVTFNGWEGGFGIGARYLVPLIPLLAIAMLELRGRFASLFLTLAILSFAINFTAAAVDPQPSATIPRPLTQYLLPLFVRGHFSETVPITPPWSAATFTGQTSVNRLAHDEAIVFQRHAPGSQESEWTSFNLGEPFFGAGDARSVLPLLALLTLGVAYVALLLRRSQAPPG
jgi:hypothetical protein